VPDRGVGVLRALQDWIIHTAAHPLISTEASVRWKDAVVVRELFQQFVAQVRSR
jgi:hypothetical protein